MKGRGERENDTILAARKEAKQQKVEKDILTQEEADQMLAQMREHVSVMVNKTTQGIFK